VSVATVTGTLTYAYPETLAAGRPALLLMHDVSGDLAVIASLVYLWLHLKRTWPIKKLALSRYSGMLTVAAWTAVAGTGIYGQLAPLAPETTAYDVHTWTSVAVIALACFHGANGLRRKIR
jgi:hypothetical protein